MDDEDLAASEFFAYQGEDTDPEGPAPAWYVGVAGVQNYDLCGGLNEDEAKRITAALNLCRGYTHNQTVGDADVSQKLRNRKSS